MEILIHKRFIHISYFITFFVKLLSVDADWVKLPALKNRQEFEPETTTSIRNPKLQQNLVVTEPTVFIIKKQNLSYTPLADQITQVSKPLTLDDDDEEYVHIENEYDADDSSDNYDEDNTGNEDVEVDENDDVKSYEGTKQTEKLDVQFQSTFNKISTTPSPVPKTSTSSTTPTISTTVDPTKNVDFNFSLMPVLLDIQQTLTAKSNNTIKSKVELLQNIKQEMLENVYARLNQFWPEDNSSPSSTNDRERIRKKRTINKVQHDHHYEEENEVEFPSNAGALLAISFLTFAVYLIKLVLNVIHALKMKANNPIFYMTTTPATYFREAPLQSRSLRDEELVLKALKNNQYVNSN